jgi:hypothetical protein
MTLVSPLIEKKTMNGHAAVSHIQKSTKPSGLTRYQTFGHNHFVTSPVTTVSLT